MVGLNVNTIADEAGTGGPDFVAMPSVGGSPIVESGSNSDGEWTRWADGTQICRKVSEATYAINTAWGSGYISSVVSAGTWPQPFVGVPLRTLTGSAGPASAVLSGPGGQTSTDAGQFQALRMLSAPASTNKMDIIGQGYWK